MHRKLGRMRASWHVRHQSWIVAACGIVAVVVGVWLAVAAIGEPSDAAWVRPGNYQELVVAAMALATAVVSIAIPIATGMSERWGEAGSRVFLEHLLLHPLARLSITVLGCAVPALLPLSASLRLAAAGVTITATLALIGCLLVSTLSLLRLLQVPGRIAAVVARRLAPEYGQRFTARLYNTVFVRTREELVDAVCKSRSRLTTDTSWLLRGDDAPGAGASVVLIGPFSIAKGFIDIRPSGLDDLCHWLYLADAHLAIAPHFATETDDSDGRTIGLIGRLTTEDGRSPR